MPSYEYLSQLSNNVPTARISIPSAQLFLNDKKISIWNKTYASLFSITFVKVYASINICCYLRVILKRCAQRRMLYLDVEQQLFSPHRTKTGRNQQILLFHHPFVSRMLPPNSKRWMRFVFSSCSQCAVAVRQLLRHNYKTGYLNTVSRRYRSTTINIRNTSKSYTPITKITESCKKVGSLPLLPMCICM